jgi:cytochrome c oxidase subunit IV
MAHGSGHHIVPISTYLKVLGALLVLTVITVAVAKPVTGVDFGMLNATMAMAIASIKAGFVLLIFMGLRWDDKLYLVLFFTSVFFLIILFAFSVLDIYSRVFVDKTL